MFTIDFHSNHPVQSLLQWAVHRPRQFLMFPVTMLVIAPLLEVNENLDLLRQVQSYLLSAQVDMCDQHDRFSVLLNPRNLKFLTHSTSPSVIKTGLCTFVFLFFLVNDQLLGFVNMKQHIVFAHFFKTVNFLAI